jgi:hypothetical protein
MMATTSPIGELQLQLDALTQNFELLRVELTEDRPKGIDLAFLDFVYDAVNDCLACLTEARAACCLAATGEHVGTALCRCHRQFNEMAAASARNISGWGTIVEFERLMQSRSGEYPSWVKEIRLQVERIQSLFVAAGGSLERCWGEFTSGTRPAPVRAVEMETPSALDTQNAGRDR